MTPDTYSLNWKRMLPGLLFLLMMNGPVHADAPTDTSTTDTDIAQSLFEEAINRRDAGDVFKAIQLLETITENRPDLERARLELAVAYHQASRYQDAIDELKAVLDNPDTPDNVRLSIIAYLGQIQNDKKQPEAEHKFSYYLKAGVLNNSNLNASQAVATGLNTSSSSEISSIGSNVTANVTHRYVKRDVYNIAETPAALEWLSQATLSSQLYTEESRFNQSILSLSTGPAFLSPGKWRGNAFIQADVIQLGSEHLATFVSLYPSVTIELGGFRSLLLEARFTTREYQNALNAAYDSNVTMLGAGYTTFLTEYSAGLEGGLRLSTENAQFDGFSHDLIELYLAGFRSFDESTDMYARLNMLQFDYDAVDTTPGVGVVRDETELQFVIGVNFDFPDGPLKDWLLNVELSTIDSDSNADTLDYKRTLVGVNVSRYFY